jgi:mono/diheme cytochrome c family protein
MLKKIFLIIVPLLAGYLVYAQFVPRMRPPVEPRVSHPPVPSGYQNVSNPLRNPGDEAVQKFIAERALAGISVPEARQRLVANYTEQGYALYQKNCSHCHGVLADGRGPMARGLRLKPANFRGPDSLAAVSESYVFWRIKEGGVELPPEATPWDSAMPAWKTGLTDEEIWKIVLAVYSMAGVSPKTAPAR